MSCVTPAASPARADVPSPTRRFTLRERILLSLISALGSAAIRLVGSTLRYEFSLEDDDRVQQGGPPEVLSSVPSVFGFWHSCIFAATYYCRGLNIGVLTSRSFDGEYIARIIENFGYRALRGTSSRGVIGGLRSMIRHVEQGHIAAFTCDGPRGPANVAKPGPVLLARQAGVPLRALHVAVKDRWELNSWDRMQIPKPFSRVLARFSAPIHVPTDATDAQLREFHSSLQAALDRVRDFAEAEARQ